MRKVNNEKEEEGGHWGEVVTSLLGGAFKKMSLDLVLGLKEQWDKFLFRTKSGAVALIFVIVGLIFTMVGLAILIGSLFGEVPGIGFIIVGIVLALVGWIASLIKKMV
ncbi:MAG: hypothetical protein PF549_00375 [Patescibacteria group bacterium]|jgi:uncharacterized membrane protein YkvI|nr:hypothetical protein [Patescibacteria group bacterium]